jgi:hypothetical protein
MKSRRRVNSAVRLLLSDFYRLNAMTRPLLKELLPELADDLIAQFERDGEHQLAAQVSSLPIIDRCRCGDDFCATFYTAPKPKDAWGVGHETIPLDAEDGYLNVDVVEGKIVSIEVLYRDEIREKLLSHMP